MQCTTTFITELHTDDHSLKGQSSNPGNNSNLCLHHTVLLSSDPPSWYYELSLSTPVRRITKRIQIFL